MPARLARHAIDDGRAGASAAEGVGARVKRIGQQLQNRVVDRQAPGHGRAPRGLVLDRGQRERLLAEPQQRLADAADLGELGEDETDRVLDTLIRVFLHAAIARLHVADGEPENQRAAPGLREQALVRSLPDPPELGFAHRAFEPQQQAVVELTWIVDALGVDDERPHQSAEVEELIPVPVVPGEPRDFEAEHRADVPETHFGDQPLESGSTRGRRPGLAEILVDDDHVHPSEAPGMPGQIVLAPPALMMVPHLIKGGLPDIDERRAL